MIIDIILAITIISMLCIATIIGQNGRIVMCEEMISKNITSAKQNVQALHELEYKVLELRYPTIEEFLLDYQYVRYSEATKNLQKLFRKLADFHEGSRTMMYPRSIVNENLSFGDNLRSSLIYTLKHKSNDREKAKCCGVEDLIGKGAKQCVKKSKKIKK